MSPNLFPIIWAISLYLGLANGNILCNLRVWETTSSERNVPEGSLPLGGINSESYIIRAEVDGSLKIGTTVKANGTDDAYVPSSEYGNSTFLAAYEILTLPEGCRYAWKLAGSKAPEFASESSPSRYFGRVMLDGTYYAGEIDYSKKPPSMIVAYPDGTEEEVSGIYVLTTSSPGLKVTLTDVNIPADPSNAGKVLSAEEIRNFADVSISQTFKHSASISSTIENVVTSKIETNSVATSRVNFLVYGKQWKEEKTYTNETTQTWTTVTTMEISVTREIIVPPYSAIQACTVVSMKQNVTKCYSATAVYTGPGLNSNEIKDILLKDGVTNVRIDEKNRVVVDKIEGCFSGNFVLDSVFYVFDLNKGDVNCQNADYNLRKSLRQKNKYL